MDSSVSPKDEIWFLRVCHHNSVNPSPCQSHAIRSRGSRKFWNVGMKIRQIKPIPTDLIHLQRPKQGICVSVAVSNGTLNKILNQNFEYFCKKFLFLSPRLTDEEADSVYRKFVEFYLNGSAVFSQQNAYQLIEVSNLISLWTYYRLSWCFMVVFHLRMKSSKSCRDNSVGTGLTVLGSNPIHLTTTTSCVRCGATDTLPHRLIACEEGPVIWTWTKPG